MTPRLHLSRRARVRVFDAARGICHICRQIIAIGERWEVEHKIALSMGGTNDETNLAPAHKGCHHDKSGRENTDRSKADRQRANHLGIPKTRKKPLPGGKDSPISITFKGPQPRKSQTQRYRDYISKYYPIYGED